MYKDSTNRLYAILNLAGLLGTIIVNGLANALPLNGRTTGALSDKYPNLFVPAAVTFAIWGVIYLLLALFVIYHLVKAFRDDALESPWAARIGPFFFIASLANMSWIFAWHYEMLPSSLLLMLVLLGSLITIYLRLDIGRAEAPTREKYLVHLPFSVYLGWITIATIANLMAWLVSINWAGFGLPDQFWTVLVIIAGIAVTLAMLWRRADIFYALVVDWALAGILLKRLSDDTMPDTAVVVIAIIGLVVATFGIIVRVVRRKVYAP